MQPLSRVILIRHGETEGESSIRFHGATDVRLSDSGRQHAIAARRAIVGEGFGLVVASSLSRARETAMIVAPGRTIRLEADFREIDFGRWEGLTKEEIAEADPILFEDWQNGAADFDFPEGEKRGDFAARVERGLVRVLSSGVASAIVVAHKGVVRAIAQKLTGEQLDPSRPGLGDLVQLTRRADGRWYEGRRGAPGTPT